MSAPSPPAAATEDAARADDAALASSDAGPDASDAGASSRPRPRPRFPKLFLAPATQNFACNNYVNCFDDEHGRCTKERDGGSFDADWTHRTRAAADGSPSACCYKTTMCKRPLPESY